MPRDVSTLPINQVRRKDRAITDENWIKAQLHQAAYGMLATAHDRQPFLNTNLFVYDEADHALYLHTARTGRTRTNIEANQKVCFSISRMGRLLPADVALDFSVEYSSVVVFGVASIIEDETEAARALQLLLDKYFPHLKPGRDYRPIISEELRRTSVYRIDIEQWSGKQKEADPDFPGAFLYGQSPT